MPFKISPSVIRLGLFTSLLVTGCAARSAPARASSRPPVVEPTHDTIGEYRTNERVACAEGTDLVYVLSRDGGLHSFDPTELRFRKIGSLSCPGTAGSRPHSMAVDRTGKAWIGYDNGLIVHASITDAHCTASDVAIESTGRIGTFGMGFAPTPKGRIGGESLFISADGGDPDDPFTQHHRGVLARIDDGSSMSISGSYPASIRTARAELSSRADGRLFAFFTSDPFVLAEIDPDSADVRWQRKLEGMRFSQKEYGSWAFAAVGSEFFFFWSNAHASSKVTRLHGDGTLQHVIADAGLEIVGAGASTCAARSASNAVATVPESPSVPVEHEDDDSDAAITIQEEACACTPQPAKVQRPAACPVKPAPKKPAVQKPVVKSPPPPAVQKPAKKEPPSTKPKRRWRLPSVEKWLS